MLRLTFSDRIALLYSSNASSFALLSVGILSSLSLIGDFTVADIPLVDRTPALSADSDLKEYWQHWLVD